MSDYGDEWSLDEDAFSQLQEIEKTIIPSTRRAAHYLATRAATAHRGSQLSSAVLNSPRVTRSGKRPSQDRPTEVLGLQRQGKQQRIGSSDYGDDVPLDDDTFSQLVEIEKAFPLTTRNAARHSLARAATPHRASHSSPSVLDGPCATPQGQGLGQDHPTQFPGLRQEGGQEDTGSGNIGGPRLDIEYDRSTSALHAWPQTLAEVKGGALNPIVIADILLSDLAEPGTGLNGPIEVAVQDKTEAGASTTKGEAPGSSQQEKEAVQETRSLWERFRQRRGFLSVSDLASCSWCETQVEYGLIGRRSARPEQRPTSIKAQSGAIIEVDPEQVHEKLEQEVMRETVAVNVETKEDEWGLHMLNTIVGLDCLLREGLARELRVWGILDRFAVIGVIDQVDLVRIRPPTPAPDLSQNRGKMDYYLRSSAEKRRKKRKDPVIVQAPSHKVFISDSKTRFTRSIPTGNREGTNMQLMMYHEMFNQLASGIFDHARFFESLSIDVEAPFSDDLLAQIVPVIEGSDLSFSAGRARNLREMASVLDAYFIQVGGAESRLEIVYRLRGDSRGSPQKARSSGGEDPRDPASKEEQEAITRAIIASLADAFAAARVESETVYNGDEALPKRRVFPTLFPKSQVPTAWAPSVKDTKDNPSKPDHQRTPSPPPRSAKATPTRPASKASPARSIPRTPDQNPRAEDVNVTPRIRDAGVIGSVRVEFEEVLLAKYLHAAGDFWLGLRPPTGPSEENVVRCSSCEFTSGCEWRTKKAAEAIERQRLLKRHAEAKLRKLDAKRRARLQARTPTPALVGESDSGKEG